MNILEACVANNIKKFIYASSAYAMSNKGSFYGISKLASEKIIEEYHNYDTQEMMAELALSQEME